MITLAAFVAGLVLLIGGAELLVRGAVRLAHAFGVPALVIGLTVVAFGTGSPELAVAVRSAWAGQADIAIGNVVGSNIFNILFILGLSSLIVPLVVHDQLVRVDVPVMIGVSAILYLMAIDGTLSRLDGAALFIGVMVYTFVLIRTTRRDDDDDGSSGEGAPAPPARPASRTVLVSLALIGLGLALLVLGSRWLVDGAVAIARNLGVSELIIGLTVIAAGTSLPEVATSVVAGVRGQRDIAVGNVVGSNIYNILMVLGLAALVAPGGLQVAQPAINFDLPVMLAIAIAVFPIFFSGQSVSRWQGALFLGYWFAYTTYVILLAARHDALPRYSTVMTLFALPLTTIALVVMMYREIRKRRRRTRGVTGPEVQE